MKETTYAWAAGILDGEGAISLTRCKVGVNRRKTPSFQLRVTVQMAHEATIYKLRGIFGGTLGFMKPKNSSKHRPTFRWYVGDLKSEAALRKMLPYLVTKKKQAELAIKYREECCRIVLVGRGVTNDAATVQLRQKFFDELKHLNTRGPRGANQRLEKLT